jgi:hypothetical protein
VAKLAVGLALSTLGAAAAIAYVVRVSTDGHSHRSLTYGIAYAVALGLVALVVYFAAALERRRAGTPPGPTGDETKRLARRVRGELDASRTRLDAAVDSGQFWNVEVEGMQRAEWDSAHDAIADAAPGLWDVVNRAYVLSDAANAAANDHYHRGTRAYGADTADLFKRLRISLREAMKALDTYCR